MMILMKSSEGGSNMATTIYGGKTAGIMDRRQQEERIRNREIQDQSLEAQREANRYNRQRQSTLDEQTALDRESARGLRERQIRGMDEDSQKARDTEARKKEAQRLNEIADGLEATINPDMPLEEVQKLYPNYFGGLKGTPRREADGSVTFSNEKGEQMVVTPAQAQARAEAHRQRAAMIIDPEGAAKMRWSEQKEAAKGKIGDREMAAGLNAASEYFATFRSFDDVNTKGLSPITITTKKAFMEFVTKDGMSLGDAAEQVGLPLPPKIADKLRYAGNDVTAAQEKYDAAVKRYGRDGTNKKLIAAKAALDAAQAVSDELDEKYVQAPKNLYWNPNTLKFEDRSKILPAKSRIATAAAVSPAPAVQVTPPVAGTGMRDRFGRVSGYVSQLTPEQGEQAAAQPQVKGDFNGDGKVDIDEQNYNAAILMQKALDSKNPTIIKLVEAKFTPRQRAELIAFAEAYERGLKLRAQERWNPQGRK